MQFRTVEPPAEEEPRICDEEQISWNLIKREFEEICRPVVIGLKVSFFSFFDWRTEEFIIVLNCRKLDLRRPQL